MSSTLQIILTSCITVVTGVIVFALGNLSVSLFVEPIHKLKVLISDIDDSINYYSDILDNTGYSQTSKKEAAVDKLKYYSSQLKSMTNFIPWYNIWAFFRIIPKRKNILNASRKILSITNNISGGQNTSIDLIEDIRHLLIIKSSNF
jgi:hypothetical protein